MSKKSPQLRFEGFTDDWEERKLGDVVGEIQSGNRLPKDSLTNGDVPYVVAQTKNDGVFKKIARGTLDYNGNPMKLFPGNSISFSIDNPEAMFYRNAEFYTSNIMRVIHEDHLTHEQYVFILENMKRFIRGYDWSRKFSGPVVSNLEYLQPSEEEQQKIGSFFKQLDDTIALHQRKLDLLKEQKKGYLQKMFPKNGAKVPELRFAGFADDWEERKLEELGNLNRGKSKHRPRNDSRLFGGKYPFIQTGDVAKAPLFLTEYTQTYSEFGIQQSKLWDIGTLLITIAANIADTAILGIKAAFPDSVIGFESTSCDVVFIKNYIDIQSDLLKRKAETSSQANLNLAKLKEMNLNVPKLKEQQKIGSFFKQLDDTIALHQRKLDLLKEQKKGFLQTMFAK